MNKHHSEDAFRRDMAWWSDISPSPSLTIVETVTPAHDETFAEEWYERSMASLEITEAFEATGVVTWPEDDREAQGRFLDIEDEVMERVFESLRSAAAEAFVRIAGEVLARERVQR